MAPFDPPDTDGLIPWLLAGAAWAGWYAMKWGLARLGITQDRRDLALSSALASNKVLTIGLVRLEARNAAMHKRLVELAAEGLADEVAADQVAIVRLLDTTTPTTPERT